MRRRALAFLLSGVVALLALAALLVPTAPPAAAGDRVWSPTGCYGEAPYNGAWLGTPGLGASYSSVFADYDVPLQWITWNGIGQSYVQVLSRTHAYYADAGYECGRFGLPYKTGTYTSPVIGYRWTYFVKPGTCDMRYIIDVFDSLSIVGVTLEGAVPGYFCQ